MQTQQAVVAELRLESETVLSVVLRAVSRSLPRWQPGAHVDLVLPTGTTRQYSIVESAEDNSWYRIAVQRDARGRGGSEYVHLFLRPGQTVGVRGPRNHFLLDESAESYLFIAGGIGITPIVAMIDRASALGKPWTLAYAAKRQASMAFLDRLAPFGGQVEVYAADLQGRMKLGEVLQSGAGKSYVYCCGPEALMEAVEGEALDLGYAQSAVHIERFKPKAHETASANSAFTVRAVRAGRNIDVPADLSLLDALGRAGIAVDSSCRNGICGTCEVEVLSGTPDHRDDVLTTEDRARGVMLACVSRCAGGELVLNV